MISSGCEMVVKFRGGLYMGVVVVFFFKQKTAYEMLRSLVGSEMCIRDSLNVATFL